VDLEQDAIRDIVALIKPDQVDAAELPTPEELLNEIQNLAGEHMSAAGIEPEKAIGIINAAINNGRIGRSFMPASLTADMLLIHTPDQTGTEAAALWQDYVAGMITTYSINARHSEMMDEQYLAEIAAIVTARISQSHR
jgi:hypothetical protein